ncbi:16499_t:CDS:2 [Funneliformis geosporum]|uniref:16499_t:CDS:1 n=1 Tax=Funneliformis geosporum TaxID=1117311 RepID=A0A9W4SUM4_9GLOM|nr:16499_t:CDS:2 [Funneliformis geosporum]
MAKGQQYLNNLLNKLEKDLVINNKDLEGELDLSEFINLERLYCPNNRITSLNLNKNKNLLELYCSENELTRLELAKNTNLELHCAFNKLTSLNLTNNEDLVEIYCQFNQLTNLDLTKNTQLAKVSCISNKIKHLEIGKNMNITSLFCFNNQIDSLDLSNNPNLNELECFMNPLESDMKSNIKINQNVKKFGGYPLYFLIPYVVKQYDEKEDFNELMILINKSDLDNLVQKLSLKTIQDPELLRKFIPRECVLMFNICSLSLHIILDNLANQLLARCLIVQSRLHFGKDIEYESNINRLSLE